VNVWRNTAKGVHPAVTAPSRAADGASAEGDRLAPDVQGGSAARTLPRIAAGRPGALREPPFAPGTGQQ